MKKIGVIGLGNPLRRDDGIGILLLQELKNQSAGLSKNLEFIDGGTGGINLLHLLPCFTAVLLIDAVNFKGKPGEGRLFTLSEIQNHNTKGPLSTHEPDFLQVLALSNSLKELPRKLWIYGIQPHDLSHGVGLSKDLIASFPTLLNNLTKEIMILKNL